MTAHHKRPVGAVRVALPLFAHAMRQAAQQQAALSPSSQHLPVISLSTSFPSVDAMLRGGFEVGRTTLLGARHGTGATAFLLQATLAAAQRGVRVAYFSEHVTESQLRGRLVVLLAHVNSYRFRAGIISPEDRAALAAARERIPWHALSFLSKKHITIGEMESHLFSYHPQLVIADLRPRPPGAPVPAERFANLLTGSLHLAQLARRQQIALVLRVILPRGAEPPSVRDLPGLGTLAQSFSSVLLLHREEMELPAADAQEPGLAHLTLVRHRGRDLPAPREALLRFDQRYAGFSDPSVAQGTTGQLL